MAQTLDQVIASLGSIYDPQIQNVQAQQAQLPQQLQNDESALQGQQKGAFDSILNGARSRGTGVAFGGIPLGEQANYTANTFLPAMANLRSTYATKGLSLQDAINHINENRAGNAQQVYQFGVQQDLAERQFQEQQRQFNEQQAAAARAAAASAAGGFNPTYGGNDASPTNQGGADPYARVDKAGAQASINALIKTNNVARINQEYNAIAKSAGYGNLMDQYKLQLIKAAIKGSNTTAYNPNIAKLLNQAINYRPPATKPSTSYPTVNPNAARSTNSLLGIKR